jgi:hypothetical protein
MADIKKAIEWLLEGKKVRQMCWEPDEYIKLSNDEVLDESDDCYPPGKWMWYKNESWELYEEPDTWKLSEHNIDELGGKLLFSEDRIKEFIQKVKDENQRDLDLLSKLGNTSEWKQGYRCAMEASNDHLDKRAGFKE